MNNLFFILLLFFFTSSTEIKAESQTEIAKPLATALSSSQHQLKLLKERYRQNVIFDDPILGSSPDDEKRH